MNRRNFIRLLGISPILMTIPTESILSTTMSYDKDWMFKEGILSKSEIKLAGFTPVNTPSFVDNDGNSRLIVSRKLKTHGFGVGIKSALIDELQSWGFYSRGKPLKYILNVYRCPVLSSDFTQEIHYYVRGCS